MPPDFPAADVPTYETNAGVDIVDESIHNNMPDDGID